MIYICGKVHLRTWRREWATKSFPPRWSNSTWGGAWNNTGICSWWIAPCQPMPRTAIQDTDGPPGRSISGLPLACARSPPQYGMESPTIQMSSCSALSRRALAQRRFAGAGAGVVPVRVELPASSLSVLPHDLGLYLAFLFTYVCLRKQC